MKTLKYRGYVATLEMDLDNMVFHGSIHGLKDVVTFHGETLPDLVQAFHDSVDAYLEFCEEIGQEPGKPYRGNFQVRTTEELHRRSAFAAIEENISHNRWVEMAVQEKLEGQSRACAICKKQQQVYADLATSLISLRVTEETEQKGMQAWRSSGTWGQDAKREKEC